MCYTGWMTTAARQPTACRLVGQGICMVGAWPVACLGLGHVAKSEVSEAGALYFTRSLRALYECATLDATRGVAKWELLQRLCCPVACKCLQDVTPVVLGEVHHLATRPAELLRCL